MKTGITFSYDIRITNFLARWKACCKGYVILYSRGTKKRFFASLKVRYDDLGFLVGEFDDGRCYSSIGCSSLL